MRSDEARRPEDLSADERRRLRLAHEKLRAASQELQALVATEPIKGRWEPEPAPAEIIEAAIAELEHAFAALGDAYREVLGWELPAGDG